MEKNNTNIVIAALYKFVSLPDYKELKSPLLDLCLKNNIKGTFLLAHEGINGTVSGTRDAIDNLLNYLNLDSRFHDLEYKESIHSKKPFLRMKVKLKKEIVTLGIEDIDPNKDKGTYVEPEQWNELINDPDTITIDTRNTYEINIGTFKNAVNPNTTNFRELPEFVEKNLQDKKDKNIAMYCTGGIRCEKSTAYLKKLGFKNVYHLKGGILNYLNKVPEEQSLWEGECFVFDERVAVDHKLAKGHYDQCHGCRNPISEEDKLSPHYQPGVQCPNCYNARSKEQINRAAERHKQIQLAALRNQKHLGSN